MVLKQSSPVQVCEDEKRTNHHELGCDEPDARVEDRLGPTNVQPPSRRRASCNKEAVARTSADQKWQRSTPKRQGRQSVGDEQQVRRQRTEGIEKKETCCQPCSCPKALLDLVDIPSVRLAQELFSHKSVRKLRQSEPAQCRGGRPEQGDNCDTCLWEFETHERKGHPSRWREYGDDV